MTVLCPHPCYNEVCNKAIALYCLLSFFFIGPIQKSNDILILVSYENIGFKVNCFN